MWYLSKNDKIELPRDRPEIQGVAVDTEYLSDNIFHTRSHSHLFFAVYSQEYGGVCFGFFFNCDIKKKGKNI